jgi:hypothetical protein
MGEFRANPNINNRLFLAKQKNTTPIIADGLYGDALLNTQNFNFRGPTIDGSRNGTPHGQSPEYFAYQKMQSNPYVRGMHPYTSNMLVDVVPSVYNTNPLAGNGGYEQNLASFNGTRPLATALDEKHEIAQRAYEDEFKMSANNPLSMQYTLNHADVQKEARGGMYDAFRLGLERTNPELEINKDGYDPILRQPEPDYDAVLESKLQKGYHKGFLPLDKERENTIANYFDNQQPLRTGTFKEGMKKLLPKITPGSHQQTQTQAGETGMSVGGANTFLGNGDVNQTEKNKLEIQRDLGNLLDFEDAIDDSVYRNNHDDSFTLATGHNIRSDFYNNKTIIMTCPRLI